MARIEMAKGLVSGIGSYAEPLSRRIMGSQTTNANNTVAKGSTVQLFTRPYSAQTGLYTCGSFMILKGPMPADVNNIGSIAAANVLLHWNSDYASSTYVAMVNEIATLNLPLIAALASGTATWFYLKTHSYGQNSAASVIASTQIHGIIGTVGEIGSGADLEIASTDIGSGNQYRLVNFKMAFPSYLDY